MTTRRGYLAAVGAAAVGGCLGGDGDAGSDILTPADAGPLSLSSPAFDDGEPIPTAYSCDGRDASPRLDVSGVSDGAASLALVVDDPDAPRGTPYVHWLLWDVPPDADTVPEGFPRGKRVDALGGAAQGTNSAGRAGYSGPCPPADDDAHTYRFMLYAADSTLDCAPGAKRPAVDDALRGSVMAGTTLIGTFDRS